MLLALVLAPGRTRTMRLLRNIIGSAIACGYLGIFVCLAHAQAQAQAQAPYFSGKALFDLCSSNQQSPAFASCVIYLNGFIGGFHVAAVAGTDEHPFVSAYAPDPITARDGPDRFRPGADDGHRRPWRARRPSGLLGQNDAPMLDALKGLPAAALAVGPGVRARFARPPLRHTRGQNLATHQVLPMRFPISSLGNRGSGGSL